MNVFDLCIELNISVLTNHKDLEQKQKVALNMNITITLSFV